MNGLQSKARTGTSKHVTIDNQRYYLPATRADVGTVAIQGAVALSAVAAALKCIRAGKPISDEDIKKIDDVAQVFEELFDALSGWTNEQR